MASNRGYTTATKVRDKLAGMVNGYFTDAMIESEINRVEGAIDATLKIGDGATGGFSFTWATGESTHWIIEAAATYGAALGMCGPSILSWNTLDQLVNAQNIFSFWFKFYMDLLEDEDSGAFIRDQ